jgi:hypothetical protein
MTADQVIAAVQFTITAIVIMLIIAAVVLISQQ